jgi:4-hydroxybenzoate polyprenyltransferase
LHRLPFKSQGFWTVFSLLAAVASFFVGWLSGLQLLYFFALTFASALVFHEGYRLRGRDTRHYLRSRWFQVGGLVLVANLILLTISFAGPADAAKNS